MPTGVVNFLPLLIIPCCTVEYLLRQALEGSSLVVRGIFQVCLRVLGYDAESNTCGICSVHGIKKVAYLIYLIVTLLYLPR